MLTPGASPAPWPALREELQIHSAGNNRDGSPAWHVCDPVRNLFFRIGWLEFEILQRWPMKSGSAIAEDIEQHTTLSPAAEDVEQFTRFLSQHQLLRVARQKPATPLWKWLLHNYLFIRIPLIRPAHLLTRLLPWVTWLFSRWFLMLTGLAATVGIVLAARQMDLVVANVKGALTWDGFIGFAGALAVSKVLHEMGHALMSTRHGVRVAHMGVALLVMWPMPYTDTGESWKLARSRHRFAIASAGMAAELMLAAWCTLLWSFMPDGNFRNALFFLATTAWVLTLLVNASPFMRFDGYYMLTDALDFPGLHERAGQQARRALRKWIPGLVDPSPEPTTPTFRKLLIAFAFSTWIYRLILFVGIAVMVYHAFFKALGILLFIVEIMVFVGRPVISELKVWWQRRGEIPRSKVVATALLLAASGVVLFTPWSTGINAPGVLRAGMEQPIYSPYAAQLDKLSIENTSKIQPGAVLVELDAPTQAQERDKAVAMASAYALSARGSLGLPEDAAARGISAQQQASRYEAESRARAQELQRLRIVATHNGTVRDLDVTLHDGTWVAPSQMVALVVDSRKWRVEALVPERERQRLQPGSAATVIVKGRTQKLTGTVVAIDDSPVVKLPHMLLAQDHGGPIALNPTAQNKDLKPAESWFRVLVEGEGETDMQAVHEVRVHFTGTQEHLAMSWIENAVSALIQQAGL